MGILHSILRFSGQKTEDEEAQRSSYPNPILDLRQSCDTSNGYNTFKRVRKIMSSFCTVFYNTLKGTLQKFAIFYNTLKGPLQGLQSILTEVPLLPLENPAQKTIDHNPSLIQTHVQEDENISGILSSEENEEREGKKVVIKSMVVAEARWIKHCSSPEQVQEDKNISGVLSSGENEEREGKKVVIKSMVEAEARWIKHCSSPEEVQEDKNISGVLSSGENEEREGKKVVIKSMVVAEARWIKHCRSPEQVQEDKNISGVLSSGENKEREGKKVVIKSMVVADDRWIKHYSSRHRILIVGDGDFSFSASLGLAFGCASNMIATSLDSLEFLKQNYKKAASNIVALRERGCKVMHGIDATKMANHCLLRNIVFDRIIYNFPFAGFFKGLSRQSVLRRHRRLVSLFLKNGKEMIGENGEIHISHKTNGFHNEWNLVSMASSHGLKLIGEVEFDLDDYPGYNTKRGFGSDNNFDCYPSKTYKFGLKRISY